MKTKTFNQVKLNNGQVVRVGDLLWERKKHERSVPFQARGIFMSTSGVKCFYMLNPRTKEYYGNSSNVNDYVKIDKKKYMGKPLN